MTYYIVYGYKQKYSTYTPTKYILGIYKNIEDAINRQNEMCGGIRNNLNKYTTTCNNCITFINVVPEGDCIVELFSTHPEERDQVEN